MPTIAATGVAAIVGGTMHYRKEGWPGDGVSRVSFNPDRTPLEAPALWLQPACDAIVVLGRAPPGFAGAARAEQLVAPIAAHVDGAQRHLVIDVKGARHRFWLLDCEPGTALTIMLPMAGEAALLAATSAREAFANDRAVANPAVEPTEFQRQRLAMLVAIFDAARAGASNREIGTGMIYPRLAGLTAQAWKASSERRHTQRMIAEAEAMVSGGYRRLLTDRASA